MSTQWPELSTKWLQLKILSNYLNSRLQYIYLIYAVFTILLTATVTPGFQVPDERAHFLRTEQVSRGVLVGTFINQQSNGQHRTSPDKRIIYPDSGGYMGYRGINLTAYIYDDIIGHPDRKVTWSQIENSKKYYWNSGLSIVNFPNTGFYPPSGYIFQAIGILIGKGLNMNILNTLILSRIINGICCAIICFFSLGLTNRLRLPLFFVLLLPLTISLFASVSQDAMLISLAALMISLIDHVESSERKIYKTSFVVILIICITAMGAARPPYFLLIISFLFLTLSRKIKIYSITIPFILIGIWGLLNRLNYNVAFAPPEMNVNSKLQMAYIMTHPLKFIGFFFQWNMVDIADKIREFIGVLGWLDLALPGYYYKMAVVMLILTFLTIINIRPEMLKLRMALIVGSILTFIGIMAAQYITWMPLETPHLGGIQSRYFIPLVPFLCLGIAGFGKLQNLRNWHIPVLVLAAVFPLITYLILIHGFITRYYLT